MGTSCTIRTQRNNLNFSSLKLPKVKLAMVLSKIQVSDPGPSLLSCLKILSKGVGVCLSDNQSILLLVWVFPRSCQGIVIVQHQWPHCNVKNSEFYIVSVITENSKC